MNLWALWYAVLPMSLPNYLNTYCCQNRPKLHNYCLKSKIPSYFISSKKFLSVIRFVEKELRAQRLINLLHIKGGFLDWWWLFSNPQWIRQASDIFSFASLLLHIYWQPNHWGFLYGCPYYFQSFRRKLGSELNMQGIRWGPMIWEYNSTIIV